jgi:hypothetical protein
LYLVGWRKEYGKKPSSSTCAYKSHNKMSCTFVVSDSVKYLMQLALAANGDGERMR